MTRNLTVNTVMCSILIIIGHIQHFLHKTLLLTDKIDINHKLNIVYM